MLYIISFSRRQLRRIEYCYLLQKKVIRYSRARFRYQSDSWNYCTFVLYVIIPCNIVIVASHASYRGAVADTSNLAVASIQTWLLSPVRRPISEYSLKKTKYQNYKLGNAKKNSVFLLADSFELIVIFTIYV